MTDSFPITRRVLRRLAPIATLPVLFALAAAPALTAAIPPNDTCLGAIAIPGNGPFPFYTLPISIADATTGPAESALTNAATGFCSVPVSRGVWYTFTPGTNASYTLTTCSGGTTLGDTVMALYTASQGCNGQFTRIDCSDDACGPGEFQSSISRPLLKDTMYFVVVWQWDTAAPPLGQSTIQLVVNREAPPANDTCATAQPIFLNTRVAGSTALASNDYQLSGAACFSGVSQTAATAGGRDVAFSFLAPEAGTYSFKAFNYAFQSGFNLVLYVADGCPTGNGTLTVTNCLGAANRSSVSTAEEVSCLPLAENQLVFVIVDDAVSTNRGSTFAIEVTRCAWESEPNNLVSNSSPYVCGVEGVIFPTGDWDSYALGNFPPGSRLFALTDGEAANAPNFDLRVTSMTETLEYDNDDNDVQFGQSAPNIAGTPVAGGPVFLRVNHSFQQDGPYRLYAVVQPPLTEAAMEIEPNDTPALANSDPLNYYHGTLAGPAPSVDDDVFVVVANDGDLVFVSLDSDPLRDQTPINAQLELLDGFGNSLALVNDSNSASTTNQVPGDMTAFAPRSPGEALVYRCSEGTYYVRVSVSSGASGPASAGDYLLSIARNCLPGDGYNTAPTLANLVATPSVEGGAVTLTGTAFDPDLGDALTVTVAWGDGAIDIVQSTGSGLLNLDLVHSYADDQPTATPGDTYQVSINVVDRLGSSAQGTAPAFVNNLPPVLANVAITSPVAAGSNAVLTGTFSDPSLLDTFNLRVNWGDGSPVQHFNYPAGATAFNAVHAYLRGGSNYTVNVTLADDDTGESTGSAQITVEGAAEPARFLGLTDPEDGRKLLQLQGTPGATYRIEWSPDLASWFTLTNVAASVGGLLSAEDASPSPNSRFYRAVAP